MKLANNEVLSGDNLQLSFLGGLEYFNKHGSMPGNANYLGKKDGVYHVNFDIDDYEITKANVRALGYHEINGHGVLGISGFQNKEHYKAYFDVIDSPYWTGTTESLQMHFIKIAYESWIATNGRTKMPATYQSIYNKYFSN